MPWARIYQGGLAAAAESEGAVLQASGAVVDVGSESAVLYVSGLLVDFSAEQPSTALVDWPQGLQGQKLVQGALLRRRSGQM